VGSHSHLRKATIEPVEAFRSVAAGTSSRSLTSFILRAAARAYCKCSASSSYCSVDPGMSALAIGMSALANGKSDVVLVLNPTCVALLRLTLSWPPHRRRVEAHSLALPNPFLPSPSRLVFLFPSLNSLPPLPSSSHPSLPPSRLPFPPLTSPPLSPLPSSLLPSFPPARLPSRLPLPDSDPVSFTPALPL